MADQRIRGQEVTLIGTVNGKTISTVSAVKDFEVAAVLEQLEEGYLGETTDRYDEIFKGVRGKFMVHMESAAVFDLMFSVIDRAKRRVAGVKINIKATLQFPNGDRVRVIMADCFFGEMPVNFGGRNNYGSMSLDFKCSDIARIS